MELWSKLQLLFTLKLVTLVCGFGFDTNQYVASKMVRLADNSPVIGRRSFSSTGKKVTEYLGIPFAEPPLGPLRLHLKKSIIKFLR